MVDMDVRAEYFNAREALEVTCEKPGTEQYDELLVEVICGTILVLQDNYSKQDRLWEITDFTREFCRCLNLLSDNYSQMDTVEEAIYRMNDFISDRPRLKVSFCECVLRLYDRVPYFKSKGAEDLKGWNRQLDFLRRNIERADRGDLDSIEQKGRFLKSDPVEWTARWEEVIDDAEREAFADLEDSPRGMGFYYSYWSALGAVLLEKYGIEWRSPSVMNRGVMFD